MLPGKWLKEWDGWINQLSAFGVNNCKYDFKVVEELAISMSTKKKTCKKKLQDIFII